MAVPGSAEAGAVVKASVAILQAAKKADRAVDWPNLHEGLLELYSIMDSWCEMASETSRFARSKLAAMQRADSAESTITGQFHGPVMQFRPNNLASGAIEIFVTDTDGLLDPKAPLLKRWRASARREASRKSLRTLLRTYCPELLAQFVDAFEERADWVLRHRGEFDLWFDGSRSEAELGSLLEEMRITEQQLISARDELRAFVITNYSL